MKKSILLLFQFLILIACDNQVVQYPVSYQNDDFLKRSQERAKLLLQEEEFWFSEIQKKSNQKYNKTESGIWITNTGVKDNTMASLGDYIEFEYQVYDLENNIIYPYSSNGRQKIILGKADIPRGLQSGLQLINEGEKARILLPSFLGFGGFGDENKIKPDQPIIMDIEVFKIQKNK